MASIKETLQAMPQEEKDAISRETFRFMVRRDENFKRIIRLKDFGDDPFQLGEGADPDDRFLFMYLCKEMCEELPEKDRKELSPFIYMMREVSFPLKVSEKSGGVTAHPDYIRWNNANEGESPNGQQVFKETWETLPLSYREWIRDAFLRLPERYPVWEDVPMPIPQTAVAAVA